MMVWYIPKLCRTERQVVRPSLTASLKRQPNGAILAYIKRYILSILAQLGLTRAKLCHNCGNPQLSAIAFAPQRSLATLITHVAPFWR